MGETTPQHQDCQWPPQSKVCCIVSSRQSMKLLWVSKADLVHPHACSKWSVCGQMTASSRQPAGLCQLEAPPLHEHLATLALRSLGEIMTRDNDPWDSIPPYNSPHQPSPINSLCNVSHRSETEHALFFFTIIYQSYKLLKISFQENSSTFSLIPQKNHLIDANQSLYE